MPKIARYLIAGIVLLLIVSVRIFETQLFYDPLLAFFRDSNHEGLPKIDQFKLYSNVFFRYMINLLLIVLFVKLIFLNQSYVKFTIIIGVITLLILLPIYGYMLNNQLNFGEMIFFYIRRFLIQPMLLIILVPCFYYQEIRNKKATN